MKNLLLTSKKILVSFFLLAFFTIGNLNHLSAQICNINYTVSGQNIQISNMEGRRTIIKVLDQNLGVVYECSSLDTPCFDPTQILIDDCGTYYLQVQTFVNWRAKYCDIFEEINIVGCGNVPECPTLNLNIGDTCDDSNPLTTNDVVQADCSCVGTTSTPVFDCASISKNIGDTCDDGDPRTSNDEVQPDCSCIGTTTAPVYDCPAVSADVGDACDDGNPLTNNDVIQTDCSCSGITPTPVYDCNNLNLNIGDPCDDGNAVTTNDVVLADCSCAGTIPPPVYDCPTLSADIGDICDDNNPNTTNDFVQSDCSCAGATGPPPSFDCPVLMANIGFPCDDGNGFTVNDLVQADCSCVGTLVTEIGIAHWDFNNCNPGLNYDEFTAITTVPPGFSSVNASIFSNTGMHSCNIGPDLSRGGNVDIAVCHGIRTHCFWVDNSKDAYQFSVTVNPSPGQALFISKLSFHEKAPDVFEWLTGETGPNNPPTKYGWRILRDGKEIGRQIDIPTSSDWSFEEFDFSNLNLEAGDCKETTYTFELLGYCAKDNGADYSIWDIDEVQLFGYSAPIAPYMVTQKAKDKSVECDGAGNYIEYENWLASNGGAEVTNPYNHNLVWSNDGATAFETICGYDGLAKVTFTATDECGRSVSSLATFSIFDTKPPILGFVPSDATVSCDAPMPTETVIAADICGGVEVKLLETSVPLQCPNESIVTRSWTITDECGNKTFATQEVTIVDNTPPVFDLVPANKTISCEEPIPTDIPLFSDNCTKREDITLEVEEITTDGFCPQEKIITKTWTITDPCGNSAEASQTITIVDDTPPTLLSVPSATTVDCAYPTPPPPKVSTSDNCDPAIKPIFSEVTFTNPDGCGKTTVRTWSATDACGNTSSQSQEITLADYNAPTITMQAQPMTVECDPFSNQTDLNNWIANMGGSMATDQCSNFGWSHDYSGVLTPTCGNAGFAEVTFTATDACGNANTTSARFTIVDNTPPDIMVEADNPMTVECDGTGNTGNLNAWLGANGNAIATDLCGTVSWSNNYSPNNFVAACGSTGSVEVIFTATDQCGNSAQTTGTFVIEDNQSPFITDFPVDIIFQCHELGGATSTGNAALIAWLNDAGGARAGDLCDTPTWTNDYSGVASSCSNNPVTFTASDDCGNSQTVQAQVIVQDQMAPTIFNLPNDVTIECGDPDPIFMPNAIDNCTSTTVFINELAPGPITPGTCPVSETRVRTWEASDNCGNSDTKSVIITVNSPTPIIDVPADDEYFFCNATNNATHTTATNTAFNTWIGDNGGAIATDPCGGTVTWSTDPANPLISGSCNSNGQVGTPVTFIATNDCGLTNSTSATFYITPFLPLQPNKSSGVLVESDIINSKGNDIINTFHAELRKAVVELNWTNNTGPLNDHFIIERSTDGITFEAIGTHDNLSEDESAKFYRQDDNSPNIGTNFYRLKLKFLDGTHLYSEVRRIHISDIEDFGLFPNPAQEEVFVALKGYQGRAIKIQMVDHLGKVTFEESLNNSSDRNYRISLEGMQNGFYTIWVFADKRRPIGKKLIVNRMY